MTAANFPEPEAEALATSDRLVARIVAAVDAAGGWLDFETYMQMALYEPGLGYYSAGSVKLGPGGDFTTAPEQGPWLAEALSEFLDPVLAELGTARLLELGAGSGALAAGLIAGLARRGQDSIDYGILEPSADLRERQMRRLAACGGRLAWLEGLPDAPLTGVILANEVVDALPVARFLKQRGEILPLGIRRQADGFCIATGPVDGRLSAAVQGIERELDMSFPEGYCSEVCLRLVPWLTTVLSRIERGGLLLLDYGMARRDYYRPERSDGTLICHYRQRAHSDALLWPGLQDLSAWVDFSLVAQAARGAGFELAGYTTQAQFLLAALAAREPAVRADEQTPAAMSALKTLVLPGEMGERFKLIWLSKGIASAGLPGRDFRSWLEL